MKPELIVALDVPESRLIPGIVSQLPPEISYYKVGLELFTSEGPEALDYLQENGKNIFLDLKLHDIPRTVANAVNSAARHGISLLTVHACGARAMLQAAAEAAGECDNPPRLIAVTTLTSLDQHDLNQLGITRSPAEQAEVLGGMALAAGIDGLVTSALEVETLREIFGDEPLLVTPGIRLQPESKNEAADQKRIATPEAAVRGGSNFLVVGRPILQADDPGAAAKKILADIDGVWRE